MHHHQHGHHHHHQIPTLPARRHRHRLLLLVGLPVRLSSPLLVMLSALFLSTYLFLCSLPSCQHAAETLPTGGGSEGGGSGAAAAAAGGGGIGVTVAVEEGRVSGRRGGAASSGVEESELGIPCCKRLPQALIIGVKKGGTRALLEALRLHPAVRALGAEAHFFDRNYERGLEWYRGLMPPTEPGQITMEKTPSYFVTREAPARIRAMGGGRTKLLVVVRDPVTRAVSDYAQTLAKRPRGTPPFRRLAFRNGSAAAEPVVEPRWSALRIGLYARHLERWLRHFPRESMLFVSGERLATRPAAELARVQDFLGIARLVTRRHFYFNATKGFPCLRRGGIAAAPHCLGNSKGRPHPHIEPELLQRLREFYRPFNLKFYQMVGQDFGWD
ncbi:unnamed protein product [Lampetra fluviatilis]